MSIFDMISSFMNPQKGYQQGQHQLNKYYKDAQGNLQPYNQWGQDAHGNLSDVMKRLLDPAGLQNEWAKGYTQSESSKNAMKMAQENGLDAASGLGLMGSNTALNAIQGGTSNIALNDRQNYMDNLMQKYLAGAGIAGNMYNTGANAAGAMSNNAMNMGNNSAQMAYGQANAPGDLFGKLLGAGIGYATGGANHAAKAAGGGGGGWSFGG